MYQNNEELFSKLIDELEEPTQVTFRAEDDWINAYFKVVEFPPLIVMLGTRYTLDGDQVNNGVQGPAAGGILMSNGDSFRETVVLEGYEIAEDGPGVDEMYLHLETVEE